MVEYKAVIYKSPVNQYLGVIGRAVSMLHMLWDLRAHQSFLPAGIIYKSAKQNCEWRIVLWILLSQHRPIVIWAQWQLHNRHRILASIHPTEIIMDHLAPNTSFTTDFLGMEHIHGFSANEKCKTPIVIRRPIFGRKCFKAELKSKLTQVADQNTTR